MRLAFTVFLLLYASTQNPSPSAILPAGEPAIGQDRYVGSEAELRILSRLAGHPEAQKLARDVIAFYGGYFSYQEDASRVSSQSMVWAPSETMSFEYASITLDSDSGREAEALVHEILHLGQVMRGQPFEASFPRDASGDEREYWSARNAIAGAVQHEMFVDEYLRMGFERSKFLSRISRPDYENLARRHANLIRMNPGWAARTSIIWIEMYFLSWIASRHGYPEAEDFAQDTLQLALKLHPDLADTAPKMQEWLLAGRFKDFTQYPDELARLYEIAKIPPATNWVVLDNSQPGHPVALRWPR
jgi:hypothetical protein